MAKVRKHKRKRNVGAHRVLKLPIFSSEQNKDGAAVFDNLTKIAADFYNKLIEYTLFLEERYLNQDFSLNNISDRYRGPVNEIIENNPEFQKLHSVFRQVLTERFQNGCKDVKRNKSGRFVSYPKSEENPVNSIEFVKLGSGCEIDKRNNCVIANARKPISKTNLRPQIKLFFEPNSRFKEIDPKDYIKLSIVKENNLLFLALTYDAIKYLNKSPSKDILNLQSNEPAIRERMAQNMKQQFLKHFKGTNKSVRDAKLVKTNRKCKKDPIAFKARKRAKQFSKNSYNDYKINKANLLTIKPFVVNDKIENSIGTDFNLSKNNTIVCSNGERFAFPAEHYKNISKKEKMQAVIDCRKNKNSKRNQKLLHKIERARAREVNFRDDFLHKVSSYIVSKAVKLIGVDDFETKRFAKRNAAHNSKTMNKSAYNAGFNRLKYYLEYKGKTNKIQVLRIDPAYTSQFCFCGNHTPKKLGDRIHKCNKCGVVMDRDICSSKLIDRLARGQSQRDAGMDISQAGATDLAFLVNFENSVKELKAKFTLTKNHPKSR
jgi:IS605 OrfB family transposase